jgi:hypothetical protein
MEMPQTGKRLASVSTLPVDFQSQEGARLVAARATEPP